MASLNFNGKTDGDASMKRNVFVHDLKNVLTGALGHLSLARKRAGTGTELADSLVGVESILRGACRLAEAVLRSEEESQPEDLSVVDVASMCAGICIPPEGFRFRLTYGEGIPMIRAPLGWVQQIFNNLLTNAVHAMGSGGEIWIHLEREVPDRRDEDSEVLRVLVSDDGPGVPGELAERIFESGFSTREGGSGVGLAATRSCLGELGGEVLLDDTVAKGARFILRIPGNGKIDRRTLPHAGDRENFSGRVLVLDDDEMVRQIAGEMLIHLGMRADVCGDGREAIERYRAALEEGVPFRLAILDLNVPKGIGGAEVAKRILEIDPEARLYISSGQETSVMKNPQKQGFAGSLRKPYTLEELAEIVGD